MYKNIHKSSLRVNNLYYITILSNNINSCFYVDFIVSIKKNTVDVFKFQIKKKILYFRVSNKKSYDLFSLCIKIDLILIVYFQKKVYYIQ